MDVRFLIYLAVVDRLTYVFLSRSSGFATSIRSTPWLTVSTDYFVGSNPKTNPEIRDFLANSAVEDFSETPELERRTENRESIPFSLEIQILDQSGEPAAPSFCTVSKDINEFGVGFLHTEALEDKWLHIKLVAQDGREKSVRAHTVHCTKLGSLGLLHLIGAQFIADSE